MNDDARAMLDLVWGEGVHAVCYQRRPAPFNTLGHYADREVALTATMRLSSQGCDTWVSANAMPVAPSSGRGRSSDVVWVVSLFADLDWGDPAHKDDQLLPEAEVRALVESFDMRPSILVNSGHGLQAWWVLTHPVDAKRGAALLTGLHRRLREHGLTSERFDLASVLRLPGTINYKAEPVEVRLEYLNGERYEPDLIEPWLAPIIETPVDTRIPFVILRPDEADFEVTPIEWFIEHTDMRSEMLMRGWQLHSTDHFEGFPTELWTRPGKPISEGHSARLFESDVLYNWSGAAHPIQPNARYDVAEFVAAYDFGGRKESLASHVRRTQMPKIGPSAPPGPKTGPLSAPQSDETPPVGTTGPTIWARLPEAFWEAPVYAHIAAAADSRLVSREAVVLSVLTLSLMHIPNVITLPPKPRHGVFNAYACLVGQPADGKGSAMDLATELLPPPTNYKHHTLGTAEGFVRAHFHADPDHEGKGPPKQVRHWQPMMIRTDEIGGFAATAGSNSERGGSLLAELKQAWSGERLGKGYANEDKGLQVERLHYRVVALMGIAPEKAEPLFSDLGGGFPERLVFAPAAVIDIPENPDDVPADPGPLDWRSPWYGWRADIAPKFEVADEVRRAAYTMNRLQRKHLVAVDPLDAHLALVSLKLAAACATLEGRQAITWSDWERAGALMVVSKATRSTLLRLVAGTHEQGRIDAAMRAAHVERAKLGVRTEHEQMRLTKKVIEVAERIHRYVREHHDCTRKQARNAVSTMQREVFEEAFDYAKAEAWVVEVETPGPGGVKRTLRAGPAQPG